VDPCCGRTCLGIIKVWVDRHHRRKSPSHSPPSPRASESPSSRGHRPVLGSLRRKWGEARICIGGTPRHSRQHPGPLAGSCLLSRYSHPQCIPICRFAASLNRGPVSRSRPNRETALQTGDFPIPDSGRVGTASRNQGSLSQARFKFPAQSGMGGLGTAGIGDFPGRVWGPLGTGAGCLRCDGSESPNVSQGPAAARARAFASASLPVSAQGLCY
jgi:hypothetical protein